MQLIGCFGSARVCRAKKLVGSAERHSTGVIDRESTTTGKRLYCFHPCDGNCAKQDRKRTRRELTDEDGKAREGGRAERRVNQSHSLRSHWRFLLNRRRRVA